MWDSIVIDIALFAGSFLIGTGVGGLFGSGFFRYMEKERERRTLDYEQRKQEQDFIDIEKREQKREKEMAIKQKRESVVEQTRRALDFGYTITQIVEWAYSSVYYNDLTQEEVKRDKNGFGWETQHEANTRRKQERYNDMQMILFGGKDPHPVLADRNILESMQNSGFQIGRNLAAASGRVSATEPNCSAVPKGSRICTTQIGKKKTKETEKETTEKETETEKEESVSIA